VHHHEVPENTPALAKLPRRLVFRTSGAAYLGVVFLVVCASPVAASAPPFALLLLIPAGLLYWLVRTRTVVDVDRGVVARRMFTQTVLDWSDIASLRILDRRWLRAVRADGTEVPLPTVRTRHLPVLALISGGRIPDPTAPVERPEDEAEDEVGADSGETAADADGVDRVEPVQP
jgi:hypothetical protein